MIGGGKARFDGVDPVTGEKRFRGVSQTEDAVYRKWETPLARSNKGTDLNFKLNPTITALSPVFSGTTNPQSTTFDITSLNDLNLLENLSVDFARALVDLAVILADLRTLSAFGDLPINLISIPSGSVMRVRFPGCDGDLVSRLCDEVGVRRGVIVEDETWNVEKDVEMALLFPFAPVDAHDVVSESDDGEGYFERKPMDQGHRPEKLEWRHMLSPSAENFSQPDSTLHSPSRKINTPSGYESLGQSDFASDDPCYHNISPIKASKHGTSHSADYEGVEGIYKFLQVCEDSRKQGWQRR